MTSFATQNSEEVAAGHPVICPQRFQKALEDQVERGQADEARLRSRRIGCACGIIAIALFVMLLVYVAFSILADDDPQLDTIIISVTPIFNVTEGPRVVSNQGERSAMATEPEEDYALVEADTESAEVRLLKGLEHFCGTPECSRYAAFLQDQLDASHNPCRNLYDHVCSRWQREHQDYASQEAPSGTYSVDDAVTYELRERLGRFLLHQDCPYPKVHRFFAACARGNLTTRAELEGVMAHLRPREFSVDAVATAIVQMARLGMSPFFDVSVTVISSSSSSSAAIRIKLSPPRDNGPVQGAAMASAHGKANTVACQSPLRARRKRSAGLSTPGTDADGTEGEFLAALERQLCLEVARSSNVTFKNCTLSKSSVVTPPWNFEWYKTTGMSQLVRGAKKQLAASWLADGRSDIDGGTAFSRKDPKLSNACLTLIGQNDPYALSYLVGTELPTGSVRDAYYHLLAIQNMIVQKLGNRSGVSISLGYHTNFQNESLVPSEYQTDIYGDASETPSLLRFLRNSTWKRWIGEIYAPRDAFASWPFRSNADVLVVPLTLVNATALQDPWLAYLSLARTAPRVVRVILGGSRELVERLNRTHLAKCVPPSKALGRQLSSSVGDGLVDLDEDHALIELASFYAPFHFYRHYVGYGSAVPGTELNGDFLFLLHYVYNMCEAVAVGLETKNAAVLRMRRHRVQTLAKSFAAALFPACEVPAELADCDIESEDLFLPRNEVPRSISPH